MKCYNHNEVDAVGTCKACSKGICKECLTDVGNGIACTATCVDEVNKVNGLVERSKTVYKRASKMNLTRGLAFTIGGAAILMVNLAIGTTDIFLYVFGGVLLISGAYIAYIGYTQKNK